MMQKQIVVLFCVMTLLATHAWARDMEPVDQNLVRVYKAVRGADEDELIRKASIDAVQMAVGRIYLGDEMIMALSLLDEYLTMNYKRFVYSVDTARKTYTGDDVVLELYIYVSYADLVKDLGEKRFLYKPRYKPHFAVFIDETLNNQPSSILLAQQEIINVLRDRAVRFPEAGMLYPPSNVNVLDSEDLLMAALKEAHKSGVELIITGNSTTSLLKKEQLYYDFFYFYQTTLNLNLIRSDTGEVLCERHFKARTYSTIEQQAIRNSVALAAIEVGNEIIDFYYDIWNKLFLNQIDYQVMFTGIDKKGLDLMVDKIKMLQPDTEVYIRSYYNNTAVLNIVNPGASQDLLHLVRTSPYPNFRILEKMDKALEAQKEY